MFLAFVNEFFSLKIIEICFFCVNLTDFMMPNNCSIKCVNEMVVLCTFGTISLGNSNYGDSYVL